MTRGTAASDTSAYVQGPVVTLRGLVPSYYPKQLAQTAALPLPPGREMRNELPVFEPQCGAN